MHELEMRCRVVDIDRHGTGECESGMSLGAWDGEIADADEDYTWFTFEDASAVGQKKNPRLHF